MAILEIRKILVPLDFSKSSLKALDYAVAFAKAAKSEIILLHVTEGFDQNLEPGFFVHPPEWAEIQKPILEQSNQHLTTISEKIGKKIPGKITTLTISGRISKEIVYVAEKNKADLIVMGTHGVSGFREFFVGSNTFRVIRDASCPVLSVQRKNPSPAFKKIMIPFRDKPHSREKVNYAIEIALLFSSEIFILGIDTEFTESHHRKILLEAEQIKKIVLKNKIKCTTKIISSTYAGDVVLKQALRNNVDLIMSMSDLDKMNIGEYFTGPFSQQIVNHSNIPVLSVKPKFNTDTVDLRFY